MQVDVGEVLRDKNPALAKWIPEMLVDYLRRVVHQDEINRFLLLYGHLPSIEFARHCMRDMGITYSAHGLDSLDAGGRYLFASNHPFGGMDGLMLSDEITRRFGDVRIVVNDILMNVAPLAGLFVPVNKHGRQNNEYARMLNDAFESQMPVITFPAGLCSRRIHGRVTDLEWKPNFIKKAVASGRDIVPVHCCGELSPFFYRLSNVRTALGIKANIEMLYLVDEMFAQRGKHFDIFFGTPVPCRDIASGPARRWSEEIRRRAYALATERF